MSKLDAIDTARLRRYIQKMFGISFEHLLVLGVVLLIFGPRRLPELGNTMGKAIRNFKDALNGVEEAKYRKIEEAPQAVRPELPKTAPVAEVAQPAANTSAATNA